MLVSGLKKWLNIGCERLVTGVATRGQRVTMGFRFGGCVPSQHSTVEDGGLAK